MKLKKMLATGISLAMALTLALAACAPTEPNPNETDNPSTPHTHTFTKWDYSDTEHWKVCPDDGEIDVSSRASHKVNKKTHTCECGYEQPHDHTYTKQNYDAAQHWMECPDDGAIDESTRHDHTFAADSNKCSDCGYTKPEVYLTGTVAALPGAASPLTWQQKGENVAEKVRATGIAMELSDDGEAYTCEVALKTADRFWIYDCTTGAIYPTQTTSAHKVGYHVDAENGYLVSFKLADQEPTWKVHTHTFTAYGYDATQHWKVCSLDGTAEPDGEKEDHDFTKGDCICGATKADSCQHEQGYQFAYDVLPEAEAEGGSLDKICPDCKDSQAVHYDKGIHTEKKFNASSAQMEIIEIAEGVSYVTGCSAGLKLKITKAGTYTVNFENVFLTDKAASWRLMGLDINATGTAPLMTNMRMNSGGKEMGVIIGASGTPNSELMTKYGIKLNGEAAYPTSETDKTVYTVEFTVSEEDLTGGQMYVFMFMGVYAKKDNSNHYSSSASGLLVTVEEKKA